MEKEGLILKYNEILDSGNTDEIIPSFKKEIEILENDDQYF